MVSAGSCAVPRIAYTAVSAGCRTERQFADGDHEFSLWQ